MSLVGIGIDLVEIARARRLIANTQEAGYRKFLTPDEQAYVTKKAFPAQHLAARIAAKEAVYKALQPLPGSRGIGWQDIEVVRGREGFPSIRLLGAAAGVADRAGGLVIHLSLSHSEETAAAIAVVERP